MENKIKWYIFAILALTSWWAFYLLSKYSTIIFGGITSTQNMAFWWFLGAFLVSTPYFFRNKKSIKKIESVSIENYKVILLISFITSIAIFLYWYVLTLTEVWTIALLSQSNVFFSLILSMLFLWEKINRKEKNYLVVVIIWFMFISTNNPALAYNAFFIILLVRFLYALQSFIVKKYWKNIDWWVFSYIRTWLIAIFLWIFTFIIDWKISFISLEFWWYVTLSIIFWGILSKWFFFEAHKYLEVWRLNIFMLFQAIITLIGSVIFFNEPLWIAKIIWAILIVWWLIFFTKEQLKHKNKKSRE